MEAVCMKSDFRIPPPPSIVFSYICTKYQTSMCAYFSSISVITA